jgi:hypothetical protein
MNLFVLTVVAIGLLKSYPTVWYPDEGEFINPETRQEREIRLSMIAEVDAEVAYDNDTPWGPVDDFSLVYAIQSGESAFEYRVHAGEGSHIGSADRGRSRCLGQIQHTREWWTEEEWLALAGTDRASTKRCTQAILRVFSYHAKRCHLRGNIQKKGRWDIPLTWLEARSLFMSYGTGHCNKVSKSKTIALKTTTFTKTRNHIEYEARKLQK